MTVPKLQVVALRSESEMVIIFSGILLEIVSVHRFRTATGDSLMSIQSES